MALVTLPLAAALILALLVYRRQKPLAEPVRRRGWLLAGTLWLGAATLFFLFFGIGEIAGGDISGVIHLAPATAMLLLALLARQRPLEGGWVLLGLAAAMALAYARNPGVLPLTAGPFLLGGLLFLAAGWRRPQAE